MSLVRPWLYLPAKLAHDLSPYGLELYASIKGFQDTPVWNPFSFKNLHFKNRLGIAGGVDKNGDHLKAWEKVGCGFIEVGTVTPLPQSSNPGRIVDRHIPTLSVWNKMGFPSAGADEVVFNLKNFKATSHIPLFVNIGKNRSTDNTQASQDYISCLNAFDQLADAYVINISSPNTKGLRDLAKSDSFLPFITPIKKYHEQLKLNSPVFLKLSPDLDPDDLTNIIEMSFDVGLDGFILTNTTLDRVNTSFYPSEGGVSGMPLKNKSIQALTFTRNLLNKKNEKKCLISVGGVMTAADVFERIDLGADLVQVYSTLIFEGPGFFRKVAQVAKQRGFSQDSRSKQSSLSS